MKQLVTIDLLGDPGYIDRHTTFRGRDNCSMSDKRECLRLSGGEELAFSFTVGDPTPGTAELVFTGCLEIYDSHAYVWKHLNSVLEIKINDTLVFDGILHWRSHEETVAFWNPFDFPFEASLLRQGENTVVIKNKGSRETLREFFDTQLLNHFSEEEALRKLTTLHMSTVEVNFVRPPEQVPRLTGVPRTAVAGSAFIVEVNTGDHPAEIDISGSENAAVKALGCECEFDSYRALFSVTPRRTGARCAVTFDVGGVGLEAEVERIYADLNLQELIIGPGAEATYWHMLKIAARGFFEGEWGNCLRISIDDFLANLHFIPLEKWKPLIRYLVRRRRYYALQRLRVPPYSKTQHSELTELADLGGRELFVGTAVVEPINLLHSKKGNEDLKERLGKYLALFKEKMEEQRLSGHRLVTFDCAGGLCGHYYRLGLDCHIAEIGPACNCLEESCCRGAAAAFERPWGVAAAMHWYCGQGAQYAYDDSRVRYACLTMLSSYLAGARQILWEGGTSDNLPVYNYILSEESWRDYGRRYHDADPAALRAAFGKALDFHRAQQLPAPKVRFAMLRGTNDLFDGTFGDHTSAYGDMSLARAWTLLKVFLPHVSWGRGGTDHGRPHRRWYSATPYGQVDVLPAEAAQKHYDKYQLLVLTSWNTMTEEMYRKLHAYVESGGTLFLALPHLATGTMQKRELTFYNDGDVSDLCGVRAVGLGGRLERAHFHTDMFESHLPREFVLSEKNPLFPDDFDELYPVFSLDVTYFTGDLRVGDAEVLAVSQRDEPVLLRRTIGKGVVYLLNSYHYPGRGRLLDLTEGIIRTLVEAQDCPIRIEDPSQRVAWFEFPAEGYTRYFFLNTDWTSRKGMAPVSLSTGGEEFSFRVPEGSPVQIVSDGTRHVLVKNPSIQITSWEAKAEVVRLGIVGGDTGEIVGMGKTTVEIR